MEVRSNRRRRDEAVESKSVGKLFITPDEFHKLQHKVTVARIKQLLFNKRLYIRDAFAGERAASRERSEPRAKRAASEASQQHYTLYTYIIHYTLYSICD